MSNRFLVENTKSIDEGFIEEFVNTPDGLPILLMNILEEVDDDVEIRRMRLYDLHPEFERLDSKELEKTAEFLKQGKVKEAEEFQIDYAIDFLKRYPQFTIMIKGVESVLSNDIKIMMNSIKEAFLGEFDYF